MNQHLVQSRLFLALLLLGAVSIVVARLIGGVALFVMLGVVVPMILIVAYAAWNWRQDFAGTTRETVADNSYYLGFLYFLVSLGVSLIGFDVKSPNVEQIVHGFGIALFTSITGLAARIMLLQSGEVREVDAEAAQRSLVAAVERFKASLESSSDLIRNSTSGIADSLGSHHDRLVLQSNELVERLTVSVGDGVDAIRLKLQAVEIPVHLVADQVGLSVAGLAQHVEAFGEEVKLVTSGVKKSAAGFAIAAGKLADVEEELIRMTAEARRALAAIPEQSEALVRFHELILRLKTAMAEISASITASSDSVAKLADHTNEVVNRAEFGALSTAAARGADALGALSGAAEGAKVSVAQLSSGSQSASSALAAAAKSTDEWVRSGAEGQREAAAQVAAVLGGVREVLSDMRLHLNSSPAPQQPSTEITKKLDQLTAQLSATTNVVEQLASKIGGYRFWFSNR